EHGSPGVGSLTITAAKQSGECNFLRKAQKGDGTTSAPLECVAGHRFGCLDLWFRKHPHIQSGVQPHSKRRAIQDVVSAIRQQVRTRAQPERENAPPVRIIGPRPASISCPGTACTEILAWMRGLQTHVPTYGAGGQINTARKAPGRRRGTGSWSG